MHSTALAQTMPRIAVQDIQASKAVMERARGDGSGVANVLEQVIQGTDSALVDRLHRSGRFQVVAGSELQRVIAAQDKQESGLYEADDPQRARSMHLAGFSLMATATIDNFQLISREATIADAFGESLYMVDTIQVRGMATIIDIGSGITKHTAPFSVDVMEETRLIHGSRQDGSYSNRLIARASTDIASQIVGIVLDTGAPPKVVGFEGGTVFFNRGKGTGVSQGDLYELRDIGAIMIDPDTGAQLGSTGHTIGWVVVTQPMAKYAEAAVISLERSPSIGHTQLRPIATLPAHVNIDNREVGPFAPPALAQASTHSPSINAGAFGGLDAASATHMPGTVAIFVNTVTADVPEAATPQLEAMLQGLLSGAGVHVISRSDVLNAVSTMSPAGSNAGTNERDETRVQRLLSDHASALALARTLGADAIVKATIFSLTNQTIETRSVGQTISTYTLNVSWSLLDGTTGKSVDGGLVQADESFRSNDNRQRIESNELNRLLLATAEPIVDGVRRGAGRLQHLLQADGKQAATSQDITIDIVLQDMLVPEIREHDGAWTVHSGRYPMTADACTVLVDGIVVGSTPGPIRLAHGTRRIRIEHPLCEPIDRYVEVNDITGSLRFPIILSANGRARWMETSRFFESLKDGAVLRDDQREMVRAFADFMRRSSITIDTSELRSLGVGQPSIWFGGVE
jgi:hypothetical protein